MTGTYAGYEMYCFGISYCCPALKLRGYADDLALRKAMRRVIQKSGKVAPPLDSATWTGQPSH
jgi:hypothetical protein